MISCYSKSFVNSIFLAVTLTVINIFNPSCASIVNGDFSNNFGGWSLDTDGLGSPLAGLNDFSIMQQGASNNSARIEIDYYNTAGDISSTPRDEAIFANTLYQPMNLTLSHGQRWNLSFDWSFSGEAPTFDDNFLVGLGDRNGSYFNQNHALGFLINPSAYGSGHFETFLDDRFNNSTDWTLEFQLNSGVDGYGSFINIDNVELTVSPVPLPGAMWLFSSSLALLLGIKSRMHRRSAP